MSEKLKIALMNKEKADNYLSNLEKLKEDKAIEDVQYNVLKTEYAKLRNDAVLRINAAKLEIKRILDGKLKELSAAKTEYKYLEVRHKVGQIPPEVFSKQEIAPKKRIADLEKTVGELQRSYNARTAAEVTVEAGVKMFGFGLGKSKKQEEPPDLVIELPQAQPQQQAKQPEKAEPVPEPVLPVVQPEPQPPLVVPPPTPTTVSVQQIEKPTPPKGAEEEKSEEQAGGKLKRRLPEGLVMASLQILPDRVVAGNHVGIIVTMKNVGKQNISHRMDLKINGETKDAANLNLEAGKSDEITFLVTAGTPGEYTIDLDGREGKFIVVAAY